METWATLFDRAAAVGVGVDEVSATLAERRDRNRNRAAADGADTETDGDDTADDTADDTTDDADPDRVGDRPEPSPARVVADADVLAADLLVGDAARDALDPLRAHSWTTLVASDALLDDAEAVVERLADADLATAWRATVEAWREPVVQPPGDHPALASAYRGGAMHVLSFDDRLTAAGTGAGLTDRFPVSVRDPRAFAALFDAEKLYPEVGDGAYPGPDRDPRA
ncbi:DUF7384 family protein [Halobaculum marinum]|uniref:PIN domain-containing protein n=1 Tax=Halobaculum marinum TaxID=3031996 RepID=A0ABD5WTT1_9EURY|nr:hypothetical protein [Halobaculum sp. DT55]